MENKGLRIFIGIVAATVSFIFLNFFFSIKEVLDNGLDGFIKALPVLLWVKLIVSALAGLISAFAFGNNSLNEIKSKTVGDNQHGSARFMNEQEKRAAYTYVVDGKEKLPGFLVGRDGSNKWIVDTSDKTICLIAPPGGGKTKSDFVPTIYYNAEINKNTKGKGASLLSLDVKSENLKRTGHKLKECGYNVFQLDFRNPLKSYRFNLLNGVNQEIDKHKQAKNHDEKLRHYARAERYAKQVSGSIVKNVMGESKDSASDFFNNTAQGLITGLILMVCQYGDNSERHIISVFKLIVELNGLIDNGNVETGDQKSKLMELLQYIDDKRVSDYVGASVKADVRTSMNIFSSALSKLTDFIDAELEQMICEHSPEIDAEAFVENPTAIFLICPDEDNSRHFFASLFIRYFTTQLIDIAEASPGMALKRKVLCLWDEFGNMPAVKDVDSLFTAARSRGIRFLFSIQSFSQLEKTYSRVYMNIILDASQILMFTFVAPTALETAKKLSEILGSKTILSGSTSRRIKTFSIWNGDNTSSYQMMKRQLMTPDEIMSIAIGNYIVVKTGDSSGQTKMQTKLPLYSDYLKVYPEYDNPIENVYKEISYLDSEKIRLLGAIAKNELTMGMFD